MNKLEEWDKRMGQPNLDWTPDKEIEDLVSAVGLDGDVPYSLGNKTYYYLRECNSGHKNLEDEEIGFASGTYDGYKWTVPICGRCVTDGKYILHSHNWAVYLKEANEQYDNKS